MFERVTKNEFGGASLEQRAYARFGRAEALNHLDLARRPAAKQAYGAFFQEPWSKTSVAPRALLALHGVYSADADNGSSRQCLETLLREYPASEYRDEALMHRASWSYCHEKKPDQAMVWYRGFLASYPNHNSKDHARWFIEQLLREKRTGERRP